MEPDDDVQVGRDRFAIAHGTIGGMVQRYRATILLSTPTFYASYTRRCSPEQFASLRFAITGAEKLREPVAHAFRDKYGLDLLEGYGCTEMAPVVSVNVPDWPESRQRGTKPGTVSHPIPGVAVEVVEIETGQPLGPGMEGLLLVKGANRMMGYLNDPKRTQEVLREGWYVTGDRRTSD
jgi:acyl-[acyl-carrier-protein]-phospholipid O-acyltransferase / long-chain-fatty-acid--[acyl-carrier-protein] ligase